MTKALTLIAILCVAGAALAEKPVVQESGASNREACSFNIISWTWDGSFDAETCDTGGAPVWAYGVHSNPEVPNTDCDGNPLGAVLGTVLNGDYPSNAGERAVLGSFPVADNSYLLEICHFYDTENSYDGGNVEIYVDNTWIVIEPIGGYPDDQLSDSANYYAFCVNDEPGFTDGPTGFARDCFDLSAYMGLTISVAVTFGSDSSVTYPGWYIAGVWAGGLVTASEGASWSTVKSLY